MDSDVELFALVRSNWHLTLALVAEMDLSPEEAQRILQSFLRTQDAVGELLAQSLPASDGAAFLDALRGHNEEALSALICSDHQDEIR